MVTTQCSSCARIVIIDIDDDDLEDLEEGVYQYQCKCSQQIEVVIIKKIDTFVGGLSGD